MLSVCRVGVPPQCPGCDGYNLIHQRKQLLLTLPLASGRLHCPANCATSCWPSRLQTSCWRTGGRRSCAGVFLPSARLKKGISHTRTSSGTRTGGSISETMYSWRIGRPDETVLNIQGWTEIAVVSTSRKSSTGSHLQRIAIRILHLTSVIAPLVAPCPLSKACYTLAQCRKHVEHTSLKQTQSIC